MVWSTGIDLAELPLIAWPTNTSPLINAFYADIYFHTEGNGLRGSTCKQPQNMKQNFYLQQEHIGSLAIKLSHIALLY